MKIVRHITNAALTLSLVVSILAPATASAARAGSPDCPTGTTIYGRAECIGYFTGADVYKNGSGISVDSVIDNGNRALLDVTNVTNFVSTMRSLLYGGGNDAMGAAFLIDTMLGKSGTSFGTIGSGVSYAKNNFDTWQDRVEYYDSQGWVQWNQLVTYNAPFQNSARSLWIKNDDIFYKKQSSETQRTIVFSNPDGTKYRIKKNCGNLVGSSEKLISVPSFNLSPSVDVKINGAATDGIAQVGDTVTFTYAVSNSSGQASGTTTCTIYGASYTGYHDQPASPETVNNNGYVPPGTGCPRTFGANSNTTLATETFTASTFNQTICRSLFVDPYKATGGSKGDEACIVVAAKPYVRVFGGDVSVGNGISTGTSTTCTQKDSASINAWNNGGTNFTGAGTQFAALALGTINEFATGETTGGGGSVNNATVPSGLAFSNTDTDDAYGGNFANLPCIPDYYSQAANTTAKTSPLGISSLTTGSYKVTGNMTIPGGTNVINPGNRITVYVDGDVYIAGDIKYSGNWTYDKTPLFELVVKGNIYIAPGVHQLDGAYIAQQKNGTKGAIYTCGSAYAPYAIDDTMYNNCNSQLVVNGLFSAYQVYLMRTSGTVSQSTTGETGTISKAAEVFNYNPALWIAQPAAGTTTTNSDALKYDAITSLPPIL
ncbi:MAG TPA: hypothetical protein VJ843_05315 [Candidatus Saccharimonadales bacterium]|nr:hypothetical protein [Candidatus Saccharimonadales bacterium]